MGRPSADDGKGLVVEPNQQDDLENPQGFLLPGEGRTPIVTMALLGANVVIWLTATAAGGTENPQVLLDFGAMFGPLIAEGQYWRLFTAMFLHIGIAHVAFNGFGLLIFGRLVERAYGHVRFLTIYILAGLAGSVASYLFNSIAIAAGASGAIFGVLGALAAFFVAQRELFGRMAQRNLIGLLVLASINLVYGLATPGIDNWAHMGGFAAGFVLGLALAPRYRLLRSPFGTPMGLKDVSSLFKRWWVAPVAASLLVLGTWAGSATLPDNSYTHVYRAERLFEQQDFDLAREEIGKAFPLDGSILPGTEGKAINLLVKLGLRR